MNKYVNLARYLCHWITKNFQEFVCILNYISQEEQHNTSITLINPLLRLLADIKQAYLVLQFILI